VSAPGVEPTYGLTPRQREQIEKLLELLAGDALAPTTVVEPRAARARHIADSLCALSLDAFAHARSIADLGSGAGFPGIPLAIALPEASFWLLESSRRKCEFLTRACEAAGVTNAQAVWARAEEWREGLGRNDVVLARAVAPQAVVLEYAAPLLRVGGSVVDWRGKRDARDERAAEAAAGTLGLRAVELREVTPFAGASHRHLHVFRKVEETPAGFPRRAGIARKRPLGR